MITERERHRSREVLNRADLLEDFFEAGLLWQVPSADRMFGVYPLPPLLVPEQPVKRVSLQGEKAGNLEWFLDAGEGNAMWTRSDS